MEKKLYDNELGTITLKKASRYRRYTLKIINGEILATMPEYGDEKKMMSFITESKAKLKLLLKKHPPVALLDEKSQIQTATFVMQIIRSEQKNFKPVLKDGVLSIFCPAQTRFDDSKVQSLLREILLNVCRHEAKRVLPIRLEQLAKEYNFTYSGIKINNSKTHWGSCTGRKSINLSLSLMRLPWHLIDYVLLHELCHTVEMNHSERFWALMDKVTHSKAKELRKELKQHSIN